jgi:hypothetical protein
MIDLRDDEDELWWYQKGPTKQLHMVDNKIQSFERMIDWIKDSERRGGSTEKTTIDLEKFGKTGRPQSPTQRAESDPFPKGCVSKGEQHSRKEPTRPGTTQAGPSELHCGRGLKLGKNPGMHAMGLGWDEGTVQDREGRRYQGNREGVPMKSRCINCEDATSQSADERKTWKSTQKSTRRVESGCDTMRSPIATRPEEHELWCVTMVLCWYRIILDIASTHFFFSLMRCCRGF